MTGVKKLEVFIFIFGMVHKVHMNFWATVQNKKLRA